MAFDRNFRVVRETDVLQTLGNVKNGKHVASLGRTLVLREEHPCERRAAEMKAWVRRTVIPKV